MAGNPELIRAWKARNPERIKDYRCNYNETHPYIPKPPKVCAECKCKEAKKTGKYCDDCSYEIGVKLTKLRRKRQCLNTN